jgi:hypothetical protein
MFFDFLLIIFAEIVRNTENFSNFIPGKHDVVLFLICWFSLTNITKIFMLASPPVVLFSERLIQNSGYNGLPETS